MYFISDSRYIDTQAFKKDYPIDLIQTVRGLYPDGKDITEVLSHDTPWYAETYTLYDTHLVTYADGSTHLKKVKMTTFISVKGFAQLIASLEQKA